MIYIMENDFPQNNFKSSVSSQNTCFYLDCAHRDVKQLGWMDWHKFDHQK